VDISIVKTKEVEDKVINHLILRLKEIFKVEVLFIGSFEIPDEAYNFSRNQYYSTLILDYLNIKFPLKSGILLAVVDIDLFALGLNFIFGEANILTKKAIISIYRLKHKDERIFLSRVTKEAVHEIGHLLGLKHCSNPNCVMFFSNSILDTDRKSEVFCDLCRSKIDFI